MNWTPSPRPPWSEWLTNLTLRDATAFMAHLTPVSLPLAIVIASSLTLQVYLIKQGQNHLAARQLFAQALLPALPSADVVLVVEQGPGRPVVPDALADRCGNLVVLAAMVDENVGHLRSPPTHTTGPDRSRSKTSGRR